MSLSKIESRDVESWSSLTDIRDSFVQKRGLEDISEIVDEEGVILKITDRHYFKLIKAEPGTELNDYESETSSRGIFTVLVASNDFSTFRFYSEFQAFDSPSGTVTRQKTLRKGEFSDPLGDKRTTLEKLNDIESGTIAPFLEIYETRKVIDEFYREYSSQLDRLSEAVSADENVSESDKREYAQTIMDRLIFLYFIQEKGAIEPPENSDKPYLLERFQVQEAHSRDILEEFLNPLFFEVLAVPIGDRGINENEFGTVPFLNGSLFTKTEIEDSVDSIRIGSDPQEGNTLLKDYIEFLSDWNWYLDETSDVGEESTITPDILGYIFEKSANRRQKGAFYTPEEITKYISTKSINKRVLNGLNDRIHADAYDTINRVFGIIGDSSTDSVLTGGITDEYHTNISTIDIQHIEILYFDVLQDISVLDPAVGSGAFLLAAQECLLSLRQACVRVFQKYPDKDSLRQETRDLLETLQTRTTSLYLKRQIIVNNLYGVDIDGGAVEVCKLRLYLSMVSDIGGDPNEIEALPNIDFNIREGDSLFGIGSPELIEEQTDNGMAQTTLLSQNLESTLEQYAKKLENFRDSTTTAAGLRDEINDLRENVKPKIDDMYAKTVDYNLEEEIDSADDIKDVMGNPEIDAITLKFTFEEKPDENVKEKLSEDFNGRFYGAKAVHLEITNDSILADLHKRAFDYPDSLNIKKSRIERPILASDLEKEYELFHWVLEFPNMYGFGSGDTPTEHRGFDVILENPPYISSNNLNKRDRELHNVLYRTVDGTGCDIFVPFMERSYELMNETGEFGIITSRQFLSTDYGEMLRDELGDRLGMDEAIDFTNFSPFEDADIYSLLMLGSSEGSSTIQCGSIRSKKGIDEVRRAIRTAQPETISGVHSFELPADHFTKERWLLLSQDELSAREKLETKSEENLVSNTHPGVDVRAPLKTGRDRILKGSGSADGSDTIEVETKSFTDSVEPSAWRRIVTNGDVSRWEVSKPEEVVFFPYERKNGEYHLLPEDELKTRYSKTYNCLKKFKQDLLDRRDSGQTYEEMGKNWYELGRVGKPADYEDEKIVVGSMINNREFALDPDKYVVATGTGNARAITLGNLDKYYVLGYLNATPVHKYVKPLCPPKQSGYYEISISVLEELPYVDIDLDDNISEMITEKLEKNSPQEMSNSITKHGIKEVTNEFNHDVVAKHGIREGSKKIETHYDSLTDEQITGLEAFIDACTAALFDLTETDTEAFARI